MRSPIGGIFRHIVDLVDAQTKAGHDIGIICNSTTGGRFEDEVIATVSPKLSLGAKRFPMRQSVALSDFVAVRTGAGTSRQDRPPTSCIAMAPRAGPTGG